jgi:putative membrane protein
MSTVRARQRAKDRPLVVTALLSALGYALVIGAFAGAVPIFPDIGRETVDLLSHAIAVVNTLATVSLALGWYWIRRGEVRKHRTAMLSAFTLILLFLLMYLPKVGGGGEKHFVGPEQVYLAYLVMLAIHIILSVVAVPIVIYAVVLGLTHTPRELRDTPHARVGRIAAGTWILSLTLGVVTYLLLNHVYDATFTPAYAAFVPA